MMERTIFRLLPILFLATLAIAQPLPHRENFPLASWILASSKDSVTISFAYSIPYNGLVFTKGQGIPQAVPGKETFEADLSFSIDATDSATGINHHQMKRNKIFANVFSVTQDQRRLAENVITMMLPKSVYKVSAEARDENQQISYLSQTETKRLTDQANVPSIVFVDSMINDGLFPSFIDNLSAFPMPISLAIVSPDTTSRKMYLKLETGDSVVIKADSLSPEEAELVPFDSNGQVTFHILASENHSLYLAKFQIDSLTEGKYRIETDLNGKTHKLDFNYLWKGKPLALRDFKTALSLLKYLVPDSTYSWINSGSDKAEKEKFDQFWKSHDPTPKTAYNELQAEYYERADYAVEHFRSISEDDGAATDRGKAYMLYGKPADIRREFRSDGTYEIWYYPNHRKDLVFKEQGAGNFILYRTENL